jgi:hypothetical protein
MRTNEDVGPHCLELRRRYDPGVTLSLLKCITDILNLLEDDGFPVKVKEQAEAIFAAREGKEDYVDYEFQEFKGAVVRNHLYIIRYLQTYVGTVHGFATRPNLDYEPSVEGYEGALQQAVNWFNKTLQTT